MAINDVIARLSVVLGMDTAAFSSGAARGKKEVSSFERHVTRASKLVSTAVTAMMGSFVVDQIVQVTRAGLDYASSLGEVASQLGVSTKALQEYRYAASQAGIEQSEMDQALSQLTRRLGDAAAGSKPLLAAFEKLGVNVRDANGHVIDAGEAIPLIAEGLQKIASPAERAAILVDLFGKSGQKLAPLLEGGAAGVNNLRDAAQKLGIVLSDEQIQNADETADKLSAMKQVLEAKIAGAVADNTDSILALADALVKLVDAAGKAATAWRYFANLDWSWDAPSISKQFEGMAVRDLGPGVELTRAPTARELAAIAANRAKDQRGQPDARFLRGAGGSLLVDPKRGQPQPTVNPWNLPVNTNLNRRRNAAGASAFGGTDWSQFTPGTGSAGILSQVTADFGDLERLSAEVAENNKAAWAELAKMAGEAGPRLVEVLGEIAPKIAALRAETQGILDRLFPDEAVVRAWKEDQAVLAAALKQGQINAGDYARAVEALRREFTGITAAIAEATQVIPLFAGPAIEETVDRIIDGAGDALSATRENADRTKVEVVRSFEDMAEGALSALSQLGNSIKGGGFLGVISSLLGVGLKLGSAGVFGKGVQTTLQKVPGNANGTGHWRGGLTLVGERGTELVDLPAGARVTPNKDLRGLGGGIAEIRPSKWFDVAVDGRIVEASPAIMDGSAKVTTSRFQQRGRRRLSA